MRKSLYLTSAIALLCATLSTAALASSMYIVQGIPGRDYAAATDPAFPVDVLLNDEVCYQRGLAFGTIAGPLTFAPGSYNVKVSIANSLAPCTNQPLIDRRVTIEPRKDISAILTLNENGTPTLLTFTNDLAPVSDGLARVLFAQAADASPVQVILQDTTTMEVHTYTVGADKRLNITLPADKYTIEINEGTTTLVPSMPLDLFSQSVTLLYTTGRAKNNTVTLETKTLKDVI